MYSSAGVCWPVLAQAVAVGGPSQGGAGAWVEGSPWRGVGGSHLQSAPNEHLLILNLFLLIMTFRDMYPHKSKKKLDANYPQTRKFPLPILWCVCCQSHLCLCIHTTHITHAVRHTLPHHPPHHRPAPHSTYHARDVGA